jgi:hypothetical protein
MGLANMRKRLLYAQDQNRAKGSITCLPYSSPFSHGTILTGPPSRPSSDSGKGRWVDRLGRTQVLVEARVLLVTPGLNPWNLSPSNLVTVEVLRPHRRPSSIPVGAGSRLTFLTHSGSLEIEGVELCVEDLREAIPRVGDRVLLGGWMSRTAGHISNTPKWDVAPISNDGTVRIQPEDGGFPLTMLLSEVERTLTGLPPPPFRDELP